ncbi:MAG: type II toxin-antitoxin system RelB/DinJ family antitoxin [bacterium]|nr:type II toxin-antitoxin system RelB/DinJ family antitoxin [bacterium]
MKTAEISARVEPQLKEGAIKIFKKMGINVSEAVNLFLNEVIVQQGLPFAKRTPNQKTFDTMKKTDADEELTEYEDVNDFYREMGI